jgi:hypothetical protein
MPLYHTITLPLTSAASQMGASISLIQPLSVPYEESLLLEFFDQEFLDIVLSQDPDWKVRLHSHLDMYEGDLDPQVRFETDDPYFKGHRVSALHVLAADLDNVDMCISKMETLVNFFGSSVLSSDGGEMDDDDVNDDPDSDTAIQRNLTPLYVAVERKNHKMVQALLYLGAALETMFNYEIPSELNLAVRQNNVQAIHILVACGASIHVCEKYNSYSLLKLANSPEAAKVLVAMGSDVNARSSVGWTVLHVIPSTDNTDLLKLLVANGSNPRARDGDMKTTPRNANNFIQDTSRDFLTIAEKFIKLYRRRKEGEVIIGLNPVENAAVTLLEHTLDPLVITTEGRNEIKDTLFEVSRAYYIERFVALRYEAFYLFLWSQKQRLGRGILQLIFKMSSPSLLEVMDSMVPVPAGAGARLPHFTYDKEYVADCWSIPSDVDTEKEDVVTDEEVYAALDATSSMMDVASFMFT